MRNPFRRSRGQVGGRSALIEALKRRSGAYTMEIPDTGTGHYIFDPASSCSIHGRRLEAWCDVLDFDVAREELHWHCLTLSQLGGDAEDIRQMGEQLIRGRQEKRIAERELSLEANMATVEGNVKSAPARTAAERAETEQAGERESALREDAEREGEKLDALRRRFNALPRRARVEIKLRVVLGVSVSFTIFDVGVMGGAFQLIPGDEVWKIILTIGVALAPISTAIAIAQWLSAAELPIREGVKATRLAIAAGALGIIGIGLIVLFRAAATGEPPLPTKAYLFLAFLQSALAIAEAMIYTVYFDSKVGSALRDRIKAFEADIVRIEQQADSEHQRARSAQARIGEIEIGAEREESKLRREPKQLVEIRNEEEGEGVVLQAIVEHAIQEGRRADQRAAERRMAEREQGDKPLSSLGPLPWVTAALAVALVAMFIAGGPSL